MTESAHTKTEMRRLREQQGRSLRSVAADPRVGVDPAYLSRVERGLVRPSMRLLVGVLDVLGATDVAAALLEQEAFVTAMTSPVGVD